MKKLILAGTMFLASCSSNDSNKGSGLESTNCSTVTVELNEFSDGTKAKFQVEELTKSQKEIKDGLILTRGELDETIYDLQADGSKVLISSHGETFESSQTSTVEVTAEGIRTESAQVSKTRRAKSGSSLVDRDGKKVEILSEKIDYVKIDRVEGDTEYPVSYKENGKNYKNYDFVTKVSGSSKVRTERTVLRKPYTTTYGNTKVTVYSSDMFCRTEIQ